MIYLTAIGLTRGGSSTVHIYTQEIQTTQSTQKIHRITQFNFVLESQNRAAVYKPKAFVYQKIFH